MVTFSVITATAVMIVTILKAVVASDIVTSRVLVCCGGINPLPWVPFGNRKKIF